MITISNKNKSDSEKKRNVCFTVLIWIFILSDLLSLKNYFTAEHDLTLARLNELILIIFSLLDLVFCYYLLKWKKWAFWGMLLCAFIIFILNIYYGVDVFMALVGLSGMLLLYGALQLKENKVSGWQNLE